VVFTLTATGQSSGTVRTAGFTDSGEGLAQVTSVTPTDGGCVFQDSLPANATEQWDVEAGKTYTVTLTNVTDAANGGTDPTMQVIVRAPTRQPCLTATKQSTGVYTFSITLPDNACNTMPIQYGTSDCSAARAWRRAAATAPTRRPTSVRRRSVPGCSKPSPGYGLRQRAEPTPTGDGGAAAADGHADRDATDTATVTDTPTETRPTRPR
jgi:hypothetical protein